MVRRCSIIKLQHFINPTCIGAFYDFTSDLSSKDTAYTSIALGLHTDTTYFTEPAGLQMFHMLSHTEGHGGETQLVDGFAAAVELWKRDKAAYGLLSTVRVMHHASGNEGISIQPAMSSPVLSHTVTGRLQLVRWNTYDRAAFDVDAMVQPNAIDGWYSAAR